MLFYIFHIMTIHTEPETRRHGFESDKKTFLVTLFSLIVLVFLCLFSFIYFVFFFFSFYILCLSSNWLHHHLLPFLWLYLSKNLFPQFLSQNYLRQIRQMVEVHRLLRCSGCLLARLYRALSPNAGLKAKRFISEL